MTHMGEWEIGAVSRRLPDNLGELACMFIVRRKLMFCHTWHLDYIELFLNFYITVGSSLVSPGPSRPNSGFSVALWSLYLVSKQISRLLLFGLIWRGKNV